MLTVLLAAYNGASYLEEQIESILQQTIPVQLVISDDGSTDRTTEILTVLEQKYPDRIILMPHDKRIGKHLPPAAANFFWLLSHTDSDYILLSDQDDIWEPEKAEILLADIKQAEAKFGTDHPILVYSDMTLIDETGNRIAKSFTAYQKADPSRRSLAEVLIENPATGGAMLFNRALLQLVNQVPESCVMHDWWITLAAAAFGKICYEKKPLYRYRQHSNNTLGAAKTGSKEDLQKRLSETGKEAARRNYRNIFAQAKAFARMYSTLLTTEQKQTLAAFITLPLQSPLGRLRNVYRNGFTKSSRILTLAQCFTIPGYTDREKEQK